MKKEKLIKLLLEIGFSKKYPNNDAYNDIYIFYSSIEKYEVYISDLGMYIYINGYESSKSFDINEIMKFINDEFKIIIRIIKIKKLLNG